VTISGSTVKIVEQVKEIQQDYWDF
jgi:hypothetical protein